MRLDLALLPQLLHELAAVLLCPVGVLRVQGCEKLLNVLGPGECFGEMAYLSDSGNERGASVSANRESRIVRVKVDDLMNASQGCRLKFDRAFIAILVERLNLANTRLTS